MSYNGYGSGSINGKTLINAVKVRTEKQLLAGKIVIEFLDGKGNVKRKAFSSIQEAVNHIGTAGTGTRLSKVLVPTQRPDNRWAEAVDLNLHGVTIEGFGHNTRISYLGDDDHTLDLKEQDITVQHLWVDQEGSGPYDAIHLYDEALLFDIDVDHSPRHGIYSNHYDVQGANLHLSAGIEDTALFFDEDSFCNLFSNVMIKGDTTNGPGYGVRIEEGEAINIVDLDVKGAVNHAVYHNGNNSYLSGVIRDAGKDGLKVAGLYSVLDVSVKHAGDYAVHVQGLDKRDAHHNVIRGFFSGDILLESNTSDNIIQGMIKGSVTDNGTRNVINGLGRNGANDPASGGDWNGYGYEGVKVLWNDGTNYYISTYIGGTWYDVQVDSPTV